MDHSKMLHLKGGFTPNKVFYDELNPDNNINTQDICKHNISCVNNRTYTYLNTVGVPSPYFQKDANGKWYSTKQDSRILDVRHNYNMGLDERPSQVIYDIFHDNVAGNVNLDGYGRNYKDYSSIKEGQIRYYIDKDFVEPFYSPVYGLKSKSVGVMYKDPMDNVRPMFNKEYNNTHNIEDGLSFINDTTKFRDDIISRQQRVHNSQKYELVYGKV